MPRAVSLIHRTAYSYDRPVLIGPQTIRLSPAPHVRDRVLRYELSVTPAATVRWSRDPQGNTEARVLVFGPVEGFEVLVRLDVTLAVVNPFDFVLEGGADRWPFAYDPVLAAELGPCLALPPVGPGIAALRPVAGETIPTLLALARRVASQVAYIRRDEPGVWPVEETLARAEGSCRDSGWVLVHALRSMGIAARFCSGYILTPDENAAELHAWAEAFLPGAGWVGFDATSGLLAAENHVALAAASDPRLCAPVSGTHDLAEVTFTTEMTLEALP